MSKRLCVKPSMRGWKYTVGSEYEGTEADFKRNLEVIKYRVSTAG